MKMCHDGNPCEIWNTEDKIRVCKYGIIGQTEECPSKIICEYEKKKWRDFFYYKLIKINREML